MGYGIPYKGNKSKIVKKLFEVLPRGKRFVDLFGGGFAVTHYAMENSLYDEYLWNDYNPLLKPLIEKAINGDYNYDKFTPKFITREEFFELKDTDGYVKWVYSFGNNGRGYLFGRNIEKYKEMAHNYVVFDKLDDELLAIMPTLHLTKQDIKSRRLEFVKQVKLYLKNESRATKERHAQLQQLERLEYLQHLEKLRELEWLPQLELKTSSYLEYEYRDGDIVYCDPPYENTNKYDEDFNHQEFYNWVRTANFPIFFSSYEIQEEGICRVLEIETRSTLSSARNAVRKIECLYCNEKGMNLLLK